MTVFLSRIGFTLLRTSTAKSFSVNKLIQGAGLYRSDFILKYSQFSIIKPFSHRNYTTDTVVPPPGLDNTGIIMKKKTIHKKAEVEDLKLKEGHFLTLAYATANSYDLKSLKAALAQQKLYEPGKLKAHEVGDVVVANPVYSVGDEPREIIFFQEGAVVFWNCSELEASNVLEFVKNYEVESYPLEVVRKEREVMSYVYNQNSKKCQCLEKESCFVLIPNRDNSLERYAFSHAMAQSARLGAWEARLGQLAAAVSDHTASMRRSGAAQLDRKQIVRTLGELFALRLRLTVESDLLDTPDFYWEEEELERLYSSTLAYFTIPRRTRVLNERLSHCVELLELLSTWASDRHHVRLEWMIIALILVEVCFELAHYAERYHSRGGQLEWMCIALNLVEVCFELAHCAERYRSRGGYLERMCIALNLVEVCFELAHYAERYHSRGGHLEWMCIALNLVEVCFELAHCAERYHSRGGHLEWMCIALNLVEVCFELAHYAERYHSRGGHLEWMCIALNLVEVCFELAHCAERYHSRGGHLEWMCIALNLVEVCFELAHYAERYHSRGGHLEWMCIALNLVEVCFELAHYAERYHSRGGHLEWMCIALNLVEVCFELAHYAERYHSRVGHLEWMCIALNLVEVCFELAHYAERYHSRGGHLEWICIALNLVEVCFELAHYAERYHSRGGHLEWICIALNLVEVCFELAHYAERYHSRGGHLEWICIALNLVEVCFELAHYAERYHSRGGHLEWMCIVLTLQA